MPTSLVTGTNRGIGLELCRQLAARGHDVIAVCRKPSRELERLGVRVESGIDLATDASIALLRDRLRGTRLDLLIANAGILREDELDAIDLAQVREQLEVNALGAMRTVSALLGALQSGAKLAL